MMEGNVSMHLEDQPGNTVAYEIEISVALEVPVDLWMEMGAVKHAESKLQIFVEMEFWNLMKNVTMQGGAWSLLLQPAASPKGVVRHSPAPPSLLVEESSPVLSIGISVVLQILSVARVAPAFVLTEMGAAISVASNRQFVGMDYLNHNTEKNAIQAVPASEVLDLDSLVEGMQFSVLMVPANVLPIMRIALMPVDDVRVYVVMEEKKVLNNVMRG